MFTDADGDVGEAGVESLDDVAVGESVSEEDGLAGVACGVSGVEDESVTAGNGGGDGVEVAGGGKAKALHGAHLAEVGLEFGGPEFGVFAVAPGDGVSGDGVGFLGESHGVGVVFDGVFEEVDAEGHEDEAEKYDGGDDDVGAANLHGESLRCGVWDRKHEVREI